MAGPRQLALALDHAESFVADDFLIGPSNESAMRMIEAWPDWPDRILVLSGPSGAGKSHLAAIWAERAGARFLGGRGLTTASLAGATATGALVVENVQPNQFDEAALFHLLNMVREDGSYLFITTETPPAGWTVRLKDLASRLRALPLVSLEAPDDELLRAVIVKQCSDRQMPVDAALVNYLVSHIERSFAAARAAVQWLDSEALRRKRPVSRALAAELFRQPDLFRE
jgi:chromosomal replication initiation ATPase DnaA